MAHKWEIVQVHPKTQPECNGDYDHVKVLLDGDEVIRFMDRYCDSLYQQGHHEAKVWIDGYIAAMCKQGKRFRSTTEFRKEYDPRIDWYGDDE